MSDFNENSNSVISDIEQHVKQFNKEERKAYRSLKVKNIIEGIKDFGQEVACAVIPGYDKIREEKELEKTMNAINKNAYARYIGRQEGMPIGTVKKEILPNGAERTSVFTQNGSIERTEYVVGERELQEGIVSNVTYQGYSMLDVNYDGEKQLVYSYINLLGKAETPKVQVVGAIRETNGKFINFDYDSLAREDMHHWKLGTNVERRLNGLEEAFNTAYEEFSANPENIIDLTQPTEEEQSQVESVESQVVADQTQKPTSFMQNFAGKVKDFFTQVPDNDYYQ